MSIRALLNEAGLAQYAEVFEAQDIDVDVLATLTADDLKELGVATVGDRRRILALGQGASASTANAAPPLARAQRVVKATGAGDAASAPQPRQSTATKGGTAVFIALGFTVLLAGAVVLFLVMGSPEEGGSATQGEGEALAVGSKSAAEMADESGCPHNADWSATWHVSTVVRGNGNEGVNGFYLFESQTGADCSVTLNITKEGWAPRHGDPRMFEPHQLHYATVNFTPEDHLVGSQAELRVVLEPDSGKTRQHTALELYNQSGRLMGHWAYVGETWDTAQLWGSLDSSRDGDYPSFGVGDARRLPQASGAFDDMLRAMGAQGGSYMDDDAREPPWCRKDQSKFSPNALLICQSRGLWGYEARNVDRYFALKRRLKELEERAELKVQKKHLRAWLKERKACRSDVACTAKSYVGRIKALQKEIDALPTE